MSTIEPIRRVPRRIRIRDPRRKAARKRKRRNLVKFIPTSDSDFAFVAENVFSCWIKADPAAYELAAHDVAQIEKAVKEYRTALARSLKKQSRTRQTILLKDDARERAEEVVRRYARIIAANPNVDPSKKSLLRIKERPRKLKQRNCPLKAPTLVFAGTVEGQAEAMGGGAGALPGGWGGTHLLKFYDEDIHSNRHRAKPDAAVRIEVFFEFVPDGEPIPKHPAERSGWPRYLRSYTKTPMRVCYPLPLGCGGGGAGAQRIVYWARWADATGDYGHFSRTCLGPVVGWSSTRHAGRALPDEGAASTAQRVQTKYVYIQSPLQLPQELEGDAERDALAALAGGQRMLEATMIKMLDAA